MTESIKNKEPENSQKTDGWLKYFLGIFVATEDMPYSAKTFLKMAKESDNNKIIWGLLSFFWISLCSIIFVSIMFLKSTDTLFNVVALSEKIEMSSYPDVEYPPWSLEKVSLYDGCDSNAIEVSGILNIKTSTFIEFRRIGSGKLQITLDSEDEKSVGSIQGFDKALTDCAVLEYTPSEVRSLTMAIDGIITIGGAVKESVLRTPILIEGKVYIADKAVMSQEYYVAEPYELSMGDKFTIKEQSTQSSGFILIDDKPGMKITYSSKGKIGEIERYKSESISLKNSFWTKLFNDETVIILWLLLGVLYTTVKVAIRFCLDEDKEKND